MNYLKWIKLSFNFLLSLPQGNFSDGYKDANLLKLIFLLDKIEQVSGLEVSVNSI